MKISVLIPARIGSKRIPQKNIKPLGGKPLLFWSIDVALTSGIFNTICVSTDSDDVVRLVREHYPKSEVEVLKRPEELATDDADLRDVCIHFLEQEKDVQFLALFMPTYPFRDPERIVHEIAPAIYSLQVDRVASVRHGSFSTLDYWIQKGDDFFRMFKGNPLWCGAGNAAYFFQRRDYFYLDPHRWPTQLGERTLRVQGSYAESIDIDTEHDFEQAENVCCGKRIKPKRLIVTSAQSIDIVAPEDADSPSLYNYTKKLGIRKDLPVLILRKADPLFTFLRWYECNSNHGYYTEETEQLIANIPPSGHSQDFPIHYIHSPFYRVLRKKEDREGIKEQRVPSSQVIFEDDMKAEWSGYTDPIGWIDRLSGEHSKMV